MIVMAWWFPWRTRAVPVVELHGLIAARPGAVSLASHGPLITRAFRAARRGGDLILDINSPGGSPVQSALLAALIRREAGKRTVRVHAVIADVGASGGYWLACAAERIHANPMSVVGSIGVIGGGFGFAGLLARWGIERRLYTAGANKARLDPFTPERAEDVTFARQLAADIHERFKNWVRERRGPRLAGAEEELFDGSFFLGDRALALGLVDGHEDLAALVESLGGRGARPRRFRPRPRGLLARLPRRLVAETLAALEEETALAGARAGLGR